MFSKALRLLMEIICCILAFCHAVFSPECRIIPLSVSLISSLLSMAVIFTICSGVFRNTCWNKQILVKIKLSTYNNRHSPAVFLPQGFIHADPAALLNKSEWLASVLSHTYPCSSPSPPPPPPSHAHSQKRQTPMVDSAHVRGLIQIVVPWWRGTVRLARGACRHEACQRAFKEPRPRKRKQMAAGITTLMDCTCSPPRTPPSAPIQPVSRKPSGGFEVEECLNAGLVHAASDHSCAMLPISLTHFHKQASTMRVYGPALLHCCSPPNIWLTINRKREWERNDRRGEENNDNNKLEITYIDKSWHLKPGQEVWLHCFCEINSGLDRGYFWVHQFIMDLTCLSSPQPFP